MITKNEWKSSPKVENMGASRGVEMQNVRVISANEGRIRVIGAVPGLTGFSPDGSIRYEYSAGAMFGHELEPGAIVDINHDTRAVVGQIFATDVTLDNEVIVDFEFLPKYAYLTPLVKSGDFDGVSIETEVVSGHMIDEGHVIITHFILTGIAVLFGKPPACDKEVCRVLSSDADAPQAVQIYDIISQIDSMGDEELVASLANIEAELKQRNQDSTITGDS